MATLTIRNLDESLKSRLRLRAAGRNRSMEEEARQILRQTLLADDAPAAGLVQRIRGRFAALGDVQLALSAREPVRELPDFAIEPARRRSKALANADSMRSSPVTPVAARKLPVKRRAAR
jgi:plasmid stability protein